MNYVKSTLKIVAAAGLALGLGACDNMTNQQQRAVTGGVIGAGAGAIVGSTVGAPLAGAAIGGAGGAAIGATTR